MPRYNIAEAKAKFSELIERAMAGEEVVIARANRPLLKLVPYHDVRGRLKPGSARAVIVEMAPDFADTPDDFSDYV